MRAHRSRSGPASPAAVQLRILPLSREGFSARCTDLSQVPICSSKKDMVSSRRMLWASRRSACQMSSVRMRRMKLGLCSAAISAATSPSSSVRCRDTYTSCPSLPGQRAHQMCCTFCSATSPASSKGCTQAICCQSVPRQWAPHMCCRILLKVEATDLEMRLQVAVLADVVHGAAHKGDGPPLDQRLPGRVVREPH